VLKVLIFWYQNGNWYFLFFLSFLFYISFIRMIIHWLIGFTNIFKTILIIIELLKLSFTLNIWCVQILADLILLLMLVRELFNIFFWYLWLPLCIIWIIYVLLIIVWLLRLLRIFTLFFWRNKIGNCLISFYNFIRMIDLGFNSRILWDNILILVFGIF